MPECRYVTFTPSGRTECSLYRRCDLRRLARQSRTVSLELNDEARQVMAQVEL